MTITNLKQVDKEKKLISKKIKIDILWVGIVIIVVFAWNMWDSESFRLMGISSPIELLILALITAILIRALNRQHDWSGITIKKDRQT